VRHFKLDHLEGRIICLNLVVLRFIEEIFCGLRGRMCVNRLYKQRFS